MIATGSGLERFFSCRGSNVLHRAFNEQGSAASSRGIAVHGYLQAVAEDKDPEIALEEVDEAHRAAAAAVNLEELRDILALQPELALAYDPDTDTARVLGAGLGREYAAAGVLEHEIPMTLDVAGVNEHVTTGRVVDYKTGWARLQPAARNWQMRGGALALARAFDLDEVGVQLITLRDDQPAKRDVATFTAADFAVFAAQTRAQLALVRVDRLRYVADGIVPDVTTGSWCEWCPSYHDCPAKHALIKAAVGGELARDGRLAPEDVADVFRKLREIRAPLKKLEQAVYAAARERPVLIEQLDNGTQIWLGVTETVGPKKLDPKIAREVVREMLDEKAVDEVSKHEVAIGRIEDAAKLRVPRGQGASKLRAIMKEIEHRHGVHQPRRHEVDLYKLQPAVMLPAKTG